MSSSSDYRKVKGILYIISGFFVVVVVFFCCCCCCCLLMTPLSDYMRI